jgi:nitrite reductase/ring-hydroxylating ferredoxin subunit
MAETERVICSSEALIDSGAGVRFETEYFGEQSPAFAVRYEGKVHAFLNRCPHVPTELDWDPGRFFDIEGLLLICSNHGAIFLPSSGRCVGGPCAGRNLIALAVEERDGKVILKESQHGG